MAQVGWLARARNFFTRTNKLDLQQEQTALVEARKEIDEWFHKASQLVAELKGCAIRSQWAREKLNAACDETVAHLTKVGSLHMMAAAFAAIILSERDQTEGFAELAAFLRERLQSKDGVPYVTETILQARAIIALDQDKLYQYYLLSLYAERFIDEQTDAPEKESVL